MANSNANTLSLKLIGLNAYNDPKAFNRIIYRNDIVHGIPADFAGSENDANTLLGMGVRNSEGDLIRPTWKDVTAEMARSIVVNAKIEKKAPAAADTAEGDEEEEEEDDTAVAPAPAPASKPASQRSAPRKTAAKTGSK